MYVTLQLTDSSAPIPGFDSWWSGEQFNSSLFLLSKRIGSRLKMHIPATRSGFELGSCCHGPACPAASCYLCTHPLCAFGLGNAKASWGLAVLGCLVPPPQFQRSREQRKEEPSSLALSCISGVRSDLAELTETIYCLMPI